MEKKEKPRTQMVSRNSKWRRRHICFTSGNHKHAEKRQKNRKKIEYGNYDSCSSCILFSLWRWWKSWDNILSGRRWRQETLLELGNREKDKVLVFGLHVAVMKRWKRLIKLKWETQPNPTPDVVIRRGIVERDRDSVVSKQFLPFH